MSVAFQTCLSRDLAVECAAGAAAAASMPGASAILTLLLSWFQVFGDCLGLALVKKRPCFCD